MIDRRLKTPSRSRIGLPRACCILLLVGCGHSPESAEPQRGTAASADRVPIRYEAHGGPTSADPTLVLVHGWGNDRSFWSDHFATLSETHRVVALDLAGFGESGENRSDWSMNAFAADVTAVIDTLAIERAVLVGFSMGGIVALETALDIPERVTGVVLVDVLQAPDADLPEAARRASIEDIRANWNDPEWVRAFAFSQDSSDAIVQRAIAALPAVPPDHWWESLEAALRWIDESTIPTLRDVQVPVAAINSDRPPTDVETYRRYIPSFTVRLMPGRGHLGVIWEETDLFDRHLRAIVAEM